MPKNIFSSIKHHLNPHRHEDSHTFINFGSFCYLKDMENTLRGYYHDAKFNYNKYSVTENALPAIIKSPEKIPKGYTFEDLIAKFNQRYTAELNISLPKLNSLVHDEKKINYYGKLFPQSPNVDVSHILRKKLIAVHVDIETKPGVWERAGSFSSSTISKMEKAHDKDLKFKRRYGYQPD